MQLAFKDVIQCQNVVREKSSDLKENSGKSQGISFGKSCGNPVRSSIVKLGFMIVNNEYNRLMYWVCWVSYYRCSHCTKE